MKPAQLVKRVEFWQKRMNLAHWTIEVTLVEDTDSDADDAIASVRTSPTYDLAEIQFTTFAVERPKAALDVTIVHELLHIVMRDMGEAVQAASEHLARDVDKMFYDRYRHAEENAVDRLARSIVAMHSTAKP